MNQGILPTLASLSSFYTSVLFYFKFSEMVSMAQVVGMVLMIVCVVFLGLEGSTQSNAKHLHTLPSPSNGQQFDAGKSLQLQAALHASSSDNMKNVILALFWGLLPAFMYTIKAYVIRCYCMEYKAWDLGLDALIFE